MKTLLTGFNPFGDLELNPSQRLVEALASRRIEGLVTEVLPTEYAAAGSGIRRLIRTHRPDRVISLGVNKRLSGINLERIAVNIDDAAIADNAGVLRSGTAVVRGAPPAYFSTLRLKPVLSSLAGRSIPAALSNHAGTFVCNHVFYSARHELERLGWKTRCGFVHVPPLVGGGAPLPGESKGLTLEQLLIAAECILDSA